MVNWTTTDRALDAAPQPQPTPQGTVPTSDEGALDRVRIPDTFHEQSTAYLEASNASIRESSESIRLATEQLKEARHYAETVKRNQILSIIFLVLAIIAAVGWAIRLGFALVT